MLTKEQRIINKKHCKNMPIDIKIQCWWFRNLEIISTIAALATSSLLISILVMLLETMQGG